MLNYIYLDSTNSDIIFEIYNKLINAYFRTNLDNAKKTIDIAKSIYEEKFKFSIRFNEGVHLILTEHYSEAEKLLTELLDISSNKLHKGYTLNNLAMSKFYQYHDAKKDVKGKVELLQESISNKEREIQSLLKDAIMWFETIDDRPQEQTKIVEKLLNISSYGQEEFKSVKHIWSGLTMSNLAEHLLLQGSLIHKKHTSFWFAIALKHHEAHNSNLLSRHLALLAIFYHTQEQTMIAEGLFNRALDLTKNENSSNRAFALKMLAHTLSTRPQRSTEVKRFYSEAQEIESTLPKWSGKLPNLHLLY